MPEFDHFEIKVMTFSEILMKIKQAYTGPRCKFFWFATLATAIFLFVWIVGPGNTVIHWAKAGREIRRQENLMEYYQQHNAQMETRLQLLKNDKDTLEKFAREQFHFAAPGEDVYIVE